MAAIESLRNSFDFSEDSIKKGFLNVVVNTGLLGRWQVLRTEPKVVCDTAHNSHGLKIVLNQIQKEQFETLYFVLGVVNDKDLDEVLPLFPKYAKYYFCKPNVLRGLDAELLQKKASTFGLIGDVCNSVTDAYLRALKVAKKKDFVYIGGSNFVVAEII